MGISSYVDALIAELASYSAAHGTPDAARLTGISQPTVWRIIHYRTRPSLDNVLKLDSAFGRKVRKDARHFVA